MSSHPQGEQPRRRPRNRRAKHRGDLHTRITVSETEVRLTQPFPLPEELLPHLTFKSAPAADENIHRFLDATTAGIGCLLSGEAGIRVRVDRALECQTSQPRPLPVHERESSGD